MIPKPSQTLNDIAMRIATHVLPNCSTQFAQADSGLITSLLICAAQDAERAIEARLQDINQIQSLYASALKTHDQALPETLTQLSAWTTAPANFTFSEVDQVHAQALAALIELHTWAEDNDPELDTQIWQFLRDHTERHKYDLPPI